MSAKDVIDYNFCKRCQGSDCRCIISLIRKNEAINLLQNADLIEKTGTL